MIMLNGKLARFVKNARFPSFPGHMAIRAQKYHYIANTGIVGTPVRGTYFSTLWHVPSSNPTTEKQPLSNEESLDKSDTKWNGINFLLCTDTYNLYHGEMKVNTDWEVSHIYNRTAGQILFGFSAEIREFLNSVIITEQMIKEAKEVAKKFGMNFPEKLFMKLVKECHGKIPLKVESLIDGTFCPVGTPFAQISNTVKGFGEIVTYFEAIFLHHHFSTACATESWQMYKYLQEASEKHGFGKAFVNNRLHSFGFRSHRSLNDAIAAGSAWALFHRGTDDFHIGKHLPTVQLQSIPALAHKVVQQFDDEDESFKKAIDCAAENSAKSVSLVIDTFDAYKVINRKIIWLSKYASERQMHVVLRPDSGHVLQQTVDIYKVVTDNTISNVTVIIGEGMTLTTIKEADLFFLENKVPLNFVTYGVGGGFHKHLDRDTCGWAQKTCYSNGGPRMKFSENPMKQSIPGRVGLFMKDGEMWVGDQAEVAKEDNLYKIAYHHDSTRENMPEQKLHQIRSRALSANASQVCIKSTPAIKSLIKRLRHKYRT